MSKPEPKVAVFGTLRFPPEKMAQVRPHLKALIDATHENDGCIAYDFGEDPFDPGLIRFSELWPDKESLDRHLRAPHIAPWRAATRDCGLLDRNFAAYPITGSYSI